MRILFKYPTRQRPLAFKRALEAYYSRLSNTVDYRFLITADTDDATMNNGEMIEYLSSKQNLSYSFGNSKSKVMAINEGVNTQEFDILVLISDDMMPIIDGFDKIIADEMLKSFPSYDGCLHFNDGRVGRRLNTLSIMGKALYNYFGYIYHPDYTSLWCDNEFQAVTERESKSVYIDTVIIKHIWEEYHNDPLNKRNEAYYNLDKTVFDARKAANFPKESVLPLPVREKQATPVRRINVNRSSQQNKRRN